jgi:hypothetical protein
LNCACILNTAVDKRMEEYCVNLEKPLNENPLSAEES